MKKTLNRDTLKYIAIIGMAMQHTAIKFLQAEPLSQASPLYWFLNLAGFITAPLMCYFLAEGYRYTHSKKKYALRLFIFAVIAQVPYALFWQESFVETIQSLNIIFNLLLCFGVLVVYETVESHWIKWPLIAAGAVLTHMFFEWGAIPIIWVLLFTLFKENKGLQLAAFAVGGLIDAGSSLISGIVNHYLDAAHAGLYAAYFIVPVLAGILIRFFYNGQQGRCPKFSKWFFYVFYPLHFLILHLICLAV